MVREKQLMVFQRTNESTENATYRFLQTDCQIHHGHVGGGDTERHSSQFAVIFNTYTTVIDWVDGCTCITKKGQCFEYWPVELRNDLADSLGSTSRGGDDVLAGTTAVPPQLTRGAVHGLLGGSDGVNCALMDNKKNKTRFYTSFVEVLVRWSASSHHQALNDAKIIIDDFSQGSQAVGCAGGIAINKMKRQNKKCPVSPPNRFYFTF